MKFRLLVFDWDGTLMDSAGRIVSSAEAAIADLKLSSPGEPAIRNIIGLGMDEAVRELFPEMDREGRAVFIDRYREHFLVSNKTPMEMFPGAEELLQELFKKGYLLAVATGKSRRGLDRVFEDTGLGPLIHASRCADETRSKPHPEMLLQVMQELGVDAKDTLMIGDTEYDMEMAQNAGAQALAVCYGVHGVERLMKHDPLDCLSDLRELTEWITSYEKFEFNAASY